MRSSSAAAAAREILLQSKGLRLLPAWIQAAVLDYQRGERPPISLEGIDEGEEDPDLYCLMGKLDAVGLAYKRLMHQGNDPLLANVGQCWSSTPILSHPARNEP